MEKTQSATPLTTNAYLKGYLSSANAHSLLNAGAAYIKVIVNITTDTNTGENTYEILARGCDQDKEDASNGTTHVLCPTPCPTDTDD